MLKKRSCEKFFGGKGLSTLNSTTYVPFPDANTSIFAYTLGRNKVGINPLSRVFQALPGAVFFEVLRPGGLNSVDAGTYGLLHELSHQLVGITRALDDRFSNGANYNNTIRVLNACPLQ